MNKSTRIALDPLWQCLCPAWTNTSLAKTPRLFLRTRTSRFQCLRTPVTARAFSSTSASPLRQKQPSYVLNPLNQHAPQERHAKTLKISSEVSPSPAPATPRLPSETPDYANESTTMLYTRMRAAAIDGKTQQCRMLAEMLIRERREKPNTQLYYSLILSNVSHWDGAAWRVSELLDEMQEEGIQPDAAICHAVLKVLSVHPDHLLRSDVLDYMQKRWYQLSDDGAHDVMAGLLREGLLEQAMERLESMRRDGIRINGWLLDMAVYTLCDVNEIDDAYRIMKMRFDAGEFYLSRSIWWCLLDKASEARHYEATQLVWTSQVNQGYLNPASGICLNVLATASQAGDAVLATEVFSHLSKRGTQFKPIHYELLINTYLAQDPPDLHRALSILSVMALERIEPSIAETRTLYTYLHDKPDQVQESVSVLRELHAQGRIIPLAVLNLLIECCVSQRNLPEAMKLYKQIHTFVPLAEGVKKSFANVETFNLLLKACRQNDPPDAAEAAFLVDELLALRVAPDALTYDRLILVFIVAGEHALKLSSSSSSIEHPSETEKYRTRGLELLDFAYRHFMEMPQHQQQQPPSATTTHHPKSNPTAQTWLPRIGTIRHLALALADVADERCWDVLQTAEDHGPGIESWKVKGALLRRDVEMAFSRAMEQGQDQDEGVVADGLSGRG